MWAGECLGGLALSGVQVVGHSRGGLGIGD
jgi:hypothetical protein